ncbi:MAG TPA: hypothetical protein VMU01_11785 [Rhizomicrobium sp.]|nr:hypothetical protein [Rhizomicrobium sp.]
MRSDFVRLVRDWRVWASVTAAIMLVLPLAVARHLNVVDGPGHEARLAVLSDILIGGRASPYYSITTFLLPNIAYDVIGLRLAWLGGAEVAARVFLGATLILTLAGVVVLNRAATGRWSAAPLAAALLVHNLMVVEGFLNYLFGLALVPWALALRLKLGGARGIAAGALAAVVLLLCHLFDFGLYAVMAFGLAVAAWRAREISPSGFALRLLEFVPALVLLALMPRDSSMNIQFEHDFVMGKLAGILRAFSCGSLTGDIAFLAGTAIFVISLLFARVGFSRPLAPGLMLLAVLYFLLPRDLGHAALVDKRLPIAFALFLIAGLDVRYRSRTVAAGLAVLTALAFVVKQGAIAILWHRMDGEIGAAVVALDTMPPGTEVFSAECHPPDDLLSVYSDHQPALALVPALAALDQTRFFGGIWAIPSQQPIAVRPQYRAAYDLQTDIDWSVCGEKPLRKVASRIGALADGRPHYLFVVRPEMPRSLDEKVVASGAAYELYRIASSGTVRGRVGNLHP